VVSHGLCNERTALNDTIRKLRQKRLTGKHKKKMKEGMMLSRQATTASHTRISLPYKSLPDSMAAQVSKTSRQSCKKSVGYMSKANERLEVGVTRHTYYQLQHQKDEGGDQWSPLLLQRQKGEAAHVRLQERRQRRRQQLRQYSQ
jgi:hypothetical protein